MFLGCTFVSIVSLCFCQSDAAVVDAADRASTKLRVTSVPAKSWGTALTGHAAPAAGTRAKLEIHYETLCPYCTELISQSLQTIWKDDEFRKRIDVAMFPAGNMHAIPTEEVSEGYKFFHPELTEKGFGYVFQCQHGDQECLGNMVQACVMKVKSKPEDHLPILFCMEAGASQESSVEKIAFECMEEADIDPDEVLRCTKTAAANNMMYLISNYSNNLSPQRQYVPWVTINGEHFEEADGGDLLGPLCRSLTSPLPAACDRDDTKSHRGGIAGKLGHWFGGIQKSGLVGEPRIGRSAEFCYP